MARGQFDRILLDAPCSATGVIRRHPDIKWLRRDQDIRELAELQRRILNALWGKLKERWHPALRHLLRTAGGEPGADPRLPGRHPDARLVPLHPEDTPPVRVASSCPAKGDGRLLLCQAEQAVGRISARRIRMTSRPHFEATTLGKMSS